MKLLLCTLCLVLASAAALPARAHWCSNIFTGPARLVIKPEKTSVSVTGAGATLNVLFRNNFPYRLFDVKMAGSASGYEITVSPASHTVGPGQQVQFTYTIKGTAGTVQASSMHLQVGFRHGDFDESDPLANQSPGQSLLVDRASGNGGEQAPALSAATLADRYASATLPGGSPYFGRTGMKQLISWFGYRFCYNDGGDWRSGDQDCPGSAGEGSPWSSIDTFPQDCMRAGVEIGARKTKLGSDLGAAQNAAINAMKAGSGEHRCLAAVVGGLLWQGGSSGGFETALNSLSAICKAAGLRALGKGSTAACTSGQYYEKAACAAAEGLQGNDAVVSSVLVQNAGDGESSGSYDSLYYAYLLYLVTMHRYASGQALTWYPSVGPKPDAGPVIKKDTGGVVKPPDQRPPLINEAGQVIPVEAAPLLPGSEAGTGTGGGLALEGGCGCWLGGSARPPVALLLPATTLLLLVRRRRRR